MRLQINQSTNHIFVLISISKNSADVIVNSIFLFYLTVPSEIIEKIKTYTNIANAAARRTCGLVDWLTSFQIIWCVFFYFILNDTLVLIALDSVCIPPFFYANSTPIWGIFKKFKIVFGWNNKLIFCNLLIPKLSKLG